MWMLVSWCLGRFGVVCRAPNVQLDMEVPLATCRLHLMLQTFIRKTTTAAARATAATATRRTRTRTRTRHSSNVWWTCFNRIYSKMLVFFTNLGHSPLKECIVFWRVFNSHFKSACSTSPNPPVKEWERLASWPSRTDRENYATFR